MSLPHLILGLLSHSALSGYDIHKAFQSGVNLFWSSDQSQIYRALYKMEAAGWVTSETVQQTDSPNKKIYHVTDDGRTELKSWLGTPFEGDAPPRLAWLGQLFFGGQLSTEKITEVFNTYLAGLRARLATMEALQDSLKPLQESGNLPRESQFQLLTLDYGIQRHQFEIRWIEDMLQRIHDFPPKPDDQAQP